MADLTKKFDIARKEGDEIAIYMDAAVKIFTGGAVAIARGTGYAVKVDASTSPPKRFVGVCLGTVDNLSGAAGALKVNIKRKGVFKFNQSGLAQADIGKKVYFSDDNTVTLTVQPVYAGRLVNLDAEGAWVEIDDATVKCMKIVSVVSPAIIPIAGTVRETLGYVCPVGAIAYVQATKYNQQTKPNFATSAALDLKRFTGGVGTSVLTGTKDVQNNTDATDTFLATGLTLNAAGHASRGMVAGDHLAAEVVTVGGLTTAGKLYMHAEVLEVGGSND